MILVNKCKWMKSVKIEMGWREWGFLPNSGETGVKV